MTQHETPTIPIRAPCRVPAELSLDEMFSDPIVQAVMQADGVDAAKLRAMMNRVADELHARPAWPDAGASPARAFACSAHG